MENIFDTDLACERRRADAGTDGVRFFRERRGDLSWERIRITNEEGERAIGRPRGHYDTLSTPRMDLLEEDEIDAAAEEIGMTLTSLSGPAEARTRLLVVGLGNPTLTPDAIGPLCASKVRATMHIRRYDAAAFAALGCAQIAVLCPGVSADSGMEAAETVGAVCGVLHPHLVIAVDALAARSAERLGTTVQISDTGIFPGGGIGNRRAPIDRALTGCPVIAAGVPTVTSTAVFIKEAAARLGIPIPEKNLTGSDMFVSPREIDGIAEAASEILSRAINRTYGMEA